jgi:putative transposase
VTSNKKRIWSPDGIYHIVSRGNRRDPLFMDDKDFYVFKRNLLTAFIQHNIQVAAFCCMTNHYHLLLRSPMQPLTRVIGVVNWRYARYYNNRYRLRGHVYEERFYSEEVAGAISLWRVSKYIHNNPVAAKMIDAPEHYPWSSYQHYLKQSALPPYLKPQLILNAFSIKRNIQLYKEFTAAKTILEENQILKIISILKD